MREICKVNFSMREESVWIQNGGNMNIGLWLIIIIECLVGVVSTAYIAISVIAVPVYKIVRKVKYGISLFD